ncbi:MAG: hypothetical protein XD40_0820 [Archaeoglobus fulgidus]|uniref:Uncharacterized protein n=1 Tax=Archaeoglobus fulgidus TaxID=2234 RepID=A0A101DEH6_ARCFL|nr:hypothetical protein [Archaeoglobus fulgidus]KUJ93999.1 MAG: hypothetical protein XD40_0820 [Archaeoglobus fulgidus]KUK07029.1 MAG: hypothetical protein XD48_0741 [Archaeoglobus fulgidus]
MRKYLIGNKYELEKKSVGRPKKEEEKLGKNFPFSTTESTAEKIAKEFNVTDRTVKNAEKFAKAVDKLAEVAGEEVKDS